MIAALKNSLRMALSTHEHMSLGHCLVAYWGQVDKTYNWGNSIATGSDYKINEICKGEFEGHCWIEKVK